MTDVRPPRELATSQDGVVARWQLIRAGLTEGAAEWWLRGMRSLRDGVYVTGLAPPTQRQHWWAAVLSSPGTELSHASAAACFGLRPVVGPVVTVTRIGNRGREHSRGLHVSYHVLRDADIRKMRPGKRPASTSTGSPRLRSTPSPSAFWRWCRGRTSVLPRPDEGRPTFGAPGAPGQSGARGAA